MLSVFQGPHSKVPADTPKDLKKEYVRIDQETYKKLNDIYEKPIFNFRPPFGTYFTRMQRKLLWDQKKMVAQKGALAMRSAVEFELLQTNKKGYLTNSLLITDKEWEHGIATNAMASLKYMEHAGEVDRYGLPKNPVELAMAIARRDLYGWDDALTNFTKDQKEDTQLNFWLKILARRNYADSTNSTMANGFRAAPKVFAKHFTEMLRKPDIIYSAYNISPRDSDFDVYDTMLRNAWRVESESDLGVDASKETMKKIARLVVLHRGVTGNLTRDIKAAKDSAAVLLEIGKDFSPNDEGLLGIINAPADARVEDLRAFVAQYKSGKLGSRLGQIDSEPHKIFTSNAR